MPRLTAKSLYTTNGAKYYEGWGKFDDLRAVPSSVKRVWQGNACVGVRREVGGNPNLYVSSVIHNFSTGTLGVRILTQWKK